MIYDFRTARGLRSIILVNSICLSGVWRAKAPASRYSGKVTVDSQPQRGCGMVLFPLSSATTLSGLSPMRRAFSQGSSFLATLGFVAESLRDSALGATGVLTLFFSLFFAPALFAAQTQSF